MDENLHKDPLENLFRKNLEDQNLENKTPAPNDWDLPSDQVWQGIGDTLNPVSTVAPKGIWLSSKMQILAMAAGLLLLIGVFTCFRSYQQQLSSLSQQVEQLTEQQKAATEKSTPTPTLPENTPAINNSAEQSATPPSKPQTQSRAEALASEQQPIASSTATNKTTNTTDLDNTFKTETNTAITTNSLAQEESLSPQTTIAEHASTIPPATPSQIQTEQESKLSPQSEAPADIASSASPSKILPNTEAPTKAATPVLEPRTSIATFALLPTSNIGQLATPKSTLSFKSIADPIIDPFRSNGSKGLYAGLFYAPSITFIKLKFSSGTPSQIRDRFGKIKSKTTDFKGLKIGYQLNDRWAVEVEGRYGSSSIKTNHPIELKYSRQKERQVGPGRYRGDYTYSIPTAYGEVDADISVFRESGTGLEEDDAIPLEIESEHRVKLASIPVIVKYRAGKGPLRLSFRGGIAANFLLKEEYQIVNANVRLAGLSHDRTKTGPRPKMPSKTSFDVLAGIGLDFQPSPHWRFSLEPSYAIGLKPFFKNSRLKTYPRTLSVSAGINYQF